MTGGMAMTDIRMHRVTEAGPVHDEREIEAVLEGLRSGLLDWVRAAASSSAAARCWPSHTG